ncbi:2,3-dimethylmalate lyase [Sulfitobacter noctilucicola]|uniref:2-methylisocitrate lyase-like PEP mutase family enzyme n=1 Tax=Sulfitobacter noctilucicola TaxID=1342301 RepID=A0A7W6Q730_9RHOB|nr:isocitrate lyase/PEP mutase family protein [Sulfitobacter noctilucicola]KIN64096.1 2,3-dimethylmalate lyase [Sulfitobacter noctilucicola]MBB4175450.1 2-methylisocitrate lyase-like PEP mutase family enzyme [Sulfitobacter noctilucicola]
MADPKLRQMLDAGAFITAPGVFDMISTLVADRMGFSALYVTGYGLAASHMGLPDAGIMTYTDMESRIRQIVQGSSTPVIADADTGYGGLLNVRHTVRGYEAAGVTAIQIEDQEYPKKCGHTPGRSVVPMKDMVSKIRVACDARSSADLLIIARTDSRTTLGLDEALRRGEAYASAGADVVFVEAPESVDEMKLITDRIGVPTLANMVSGGMTPVLPSDELARLGFAIGIHPALGFLAVGQALKDAYGTLAEKGDVSGAKLEDFEAFSKLMGFEDVWEFDRKWAQG